MTQKVDYELHDYCISGVFYGAPNLVLEMSNRTYSPEIKGFIYTKECSLIFSAVSEIDAQKMRGRSRLTRKPKFFKTVRDLLSKIEGYSNPQQPISSIEQVEDGYILHTHVIGEFYIQASSYRVERWREA